VPEEYGGQGGDLLDQTIVCEELSRTMGGLAWLWGITVWSGARAILHHGNAAQKESYLPAVAAGDLVDEEFDMQRYWRDARLYRIGPITNEMASNYIGESLGLPVRFERQGARSHRRDCPCRRCWTSPPARTGGHVPGRAGLGHRSVRAVGVVRPRPGQPGRGPDRNVSAAEVEDRIATVPGVAVIQVVAGHRARYRP
jgi:Acyl-CoA dehydrogenase, N-terminal domain